MSIEGDEIVEMLRDKRIRDSRLMAFVIDAHEICDILAGRARITNLPDDGAVVRWSTPYELNGIALIIWSASYEPVPPPLHIPYAMAQVERG